MSETGLEPQLVRARDVGDKQCDVGTTQACATRKSVYGAFIKHPCKREINVARV